MPSNDIGVFCNVTNAYVLTAYGGSENFYRYAAPSSSTQGSWEALLASKSQYYTAALLGVV